MTIKEIVASIKAKQPEIKTVYFVGCGASQSDLFPANISWRTTLRSFVQVSILQITLITLLQLV